MAVAGSLTYDTKIDRDGFDKGLKDIENSTQKSSTKIRNIVTALGIDKIISTAISTINNSIDGAVSRIDTLNNFPKVMTNLGIATQESTEAMEILNEGLQGIPTKLDDAALATQRFTSKNGDVKKSVDLFLAVNNALLAGGASTEIQSSALEQLSQAYAKGKPDMMEWRSIQTAIPAQLKQISKAMLGNKDALNSYLKKAREYSDANPLSSTAKELVEQLEEVRNGSGDMTVALGTALRTGIISMDDFIDTIVKLNKEGTGEFLSFAEQAKNSTGGIKTSITNAKTAITRGVASIVTTIDETLKKNSLGGLSTVINKIGKTSENILKKVASLIPKIVSKIKDVYNWIKKNKDMVKNLVIVLASLTAGYIAYQKVLVAIKAIQTVKNIMSTISAFLTLIPTIRSAKDAMLLLNMAFSVNPVGLVVAGVVALTAALVAFCSRQTEAQKEAKKFAEEMENSRKAFEEYNENIDKNARAELAQINAVERLKDELKQLVDENGKVKEGYKGRVDFILNQLNEALGTEYKRTGEIINNYKKLQKEIDNLIIKKKAQIKLEASEEKYKNAIKEEENALNELKRAREELNEVAEKYGMSLDELREKAKNSHEAEKEEIENTLKGYDEAVTKYKENTEIQKQYANDYALYMQGKYEEVGKNIKESTSEWTDGTLKTLKEGIEKQSKELDTWKSVYEVAGTELSKKQKENAEKNLKELSQNLADRTSTIESLGKDEYLAWKQLAEGNYRIYSEQLNKMTPEMRKKIEDLTGYLQGDTSLPESMKMLVKRTTSKYEEEMKLLPTITDTKLKDTGKVIENDLSVTRASKILATNAKEAFNNNIDARKWGIDLVSNLSNGMTSLTSQKRISGSAATVAGLIRANIGHSVPEKGPLKDELTYMPDMIDNLVEGIEKNKYKVANKTSELAKDIKNSFDLDSLNNEIIAKMNRAVSLETGSINAKASVKANNSMLNVIQANFNIDGSINIDGQRAGRILTPYMTKTLRTGGVY